MNETIIPHRSEYTLEDHYIPAAFSSIFALLSMIMSLIILILIWKNKPRLHTVNHLLICNTCVASIFFCVITINNYLFLLFIRWERSDVGCRWRGYFIYTGIAALLYSYLIQSISRFSFAILSRKYIWLTTFQTHYYLILIQWILVFILAIPNVLTNDIRYSPTHLCWVPIECILHTAYTYFAYYVIPVVLILIIYFVIFYRMKKNGPTLRNSLNRQKRDIEILRNIVILTSIYLGGGLPTIIGDSTSSKVPYLVSLVTQVLAVLVANICTSLLDREIRQIIRNILLTKKTTVIPFNKNKCHNGNIQINS